MTDTYTLAAKIPVPGDTPFTASNVESVVGQCVTVYGTAAADAPPLAKAAVVDAHLDEDGGITMTLALVVAEDAEARLTALLDDCGPDMVAEVVTHQEHAGDGEYDDVQVLDMHPAGHETAPA